MVWSRPGRELGILACNHNQDMRPRGSLGPGNYSRHHHAAHPPAVGFGIANGPVMSPGTGPGCGFHGGQEPPQVKSRVAVGHWRTLYMNAVERRRELGELLRQRRDLVRPEEIGLTRGERRRTRGLRREEVAALAGISPSWYTWLEQGRDIHPSAQALRRIAVALRLAPEEWAYLSLLAGLRPSEILPSTSSPIAASVLPQIMEGFKALPAVTYNRRFDVLAANRVAHAIYGRDMDVGSRCDRNMIWRFFMDPERRRMYPDGLADLGVRNLIETLRMNSAADVDEDGVGDLIDDLRRRSGEFDTVWRERRVASLTTTPGCVLPLGSDEAIPVHYTRLSVEGLPAHAIAALVPRGRTAALSLERCLDARH